MRYKGLDLNLLVVFQLLLEERNVSRAAVRLHITQPAVSAALARLRETFDDELLVPYGRRMMPTARAESLVPLVRELLARADAVLSTSQNFDPATSQRSFRLVASDLVTAVLIPRLLLLLQQRAPAIRIEVLAPNPQSLGELERGTLDLLISPEPFLVPGHPAELLFEETFVVAGWRDNPALHGVAGAAVLDEAAYLAHGHVAVDMGPGAVPAFVEQHMSALGKERRIEVVVPSFAAVPRLLIGTQRLATMHRRLAELLAVSLPLQLVELPFPFPAMREMCQHHQARAGDAGLAWLRGMLRAAAEPSVELIETH